MFLTHFYFNNTLKHQYRSSLTSLSCAASCKLFIIFINTEESVFFRSHLEEALHVLQHINSTITEVILLGYTRTRTLHHIFPKTSLWSFSDLPLHLQIPAQTPAQLEHFTKYSCLMSKTKLQTAFSQDHRVNTYKAFNLQLVYILKSVIDVCNVY